MKNEVVSYGRPSLKQRTLIINGAIQAQFPPPKPHESPSLPFLSTPTRILDSVETTPLKQRRSAQTPLSRQIPSMLDFSSIFVHLLPLGGSKPFTGDIRKSARFREPQISVGEIHWIIFIRFCYHGSIKLYNVYTMHVQTVTGITQ